MKIEHVALWTENLETLRDFYMRWFDATAGEKYSNPKNQFDSYFLSFESGARLEIMQRPGLASRVDDIHAPMRGWIHLALSVGSRERVDSLTEAMRAAGVEITGEPRQTGDGYYESVVRDPDGNLIEITI